MRNNKTAGTNEIPAEIYKYGGQHTIDYLTWICNIVWKTKKIPMEWASAVIYPVHKKGDRTECNNYRAISLLSHAGKIYERIFELRKHFMKHNMAFIPTVEQQTSVLP